MSRTAIRVGGPAGAVPARSRNHGPHSFIKYIFNLMYILSMYFILNTYTGLSRVCPSYRILLNKRVRSHIILNIIASKPPLIRYKNGCNHSG